MSVSSRSASRSATTSTRQGNSRVPRVFAMYGSRSITCSSRSRFSSTFLGYAGKRPFSVFGAAGCQVHARVVEQIRLGDARPSGRPAAATIAGSDENRPGVISVIFDLFVQPLLVREQARLLGEVEQVVAGER